MADSRFIYINMRSSVHIPSSIRLGIQAKGEIVYDAHRRCFGSQLIPARYVRRALVKETDLSYALNGEHMIEAQRPCLIKYLGCHL
jgi:hypothetical protein